jgi:transcription elongation factor Elf1
MESCPFCRSTDLKPIDYGGNQVVIQCQTCQAEGPVAVTTHSAEVLWNTRPKEA